MNITWKMSIGYPQVIRAGEIEIPDEKLEDMNVEEIEEYINLQVEIESEIFIHRTWEIKK
ncbi:DUF7167 family protein [Paenibacillus alba]|uniref:DUF7167 domain-containing protein n=1 Tax=Paenibacillus alba TaxID=1197127 RepID=A0ABU6FY48_9BACL|nr:hypothetical protein [Paenibacillus alba]MEC0226821.1 hypothetical protein [Paenibacillus alba]